MLHSTYVISTSNIRNSRAISSGYLLCIWFSGVDHININKDVQGLYSIRLSMFSSAAPNNQKRWEVANSREESNLESSILHDLVGKKSAVKMSSWV